LLTTGYKIRNRLGTRVVHRSISFLRDQKLPIFAIFSSLASDLADTRFKVR
jgi:hypothetical protein